ncbi:hypothetical protein ACU8V4_03725 [Pseudoalteromonas mariniglutinosa]
MFDKCSTTTKVITVVLFLLIPIVAIGSFLTYFGVGPAKTLADWGATGDFFGGILNPVFSFATIILLLVSIRVQLKELGLTRNELKLTRIEHSKARKAQEEHQKNSKDLLNREENNQLMKLIDSEEKRIDSCLQWKFLDIKVDSMNHTLFKNSMTGARRAEMKSKIFLLETSYLNKVKLVTIYAEKNKDDFANYLIQSTLDQFQYLYILRWLAIYTDNSKELENILYSLSEHTEKPYLKDRIEKYITKLKK